MREMEELTSLEMVENFINKHHLSFLYISRTNCSVCHALLPQVRDVLEQFPLIQLGHINADHVQEIAGYFSVFTAPVLLLFVDGKEYVREARFVHLDQFKEKIKKIYDLSTLNESN
jgi:thiol-disulfide isomerase/thioredoxin